MQTRRTTSRTMSSWTATRSPTNQTTQKMTMPSCMESGKTMFIQTLAAEMCQMSLMTGINCSRIPLRRITLIRVT